LSVPLGWEAPWSCSEFDMVFLVYFVSKTKSFVSKTKCSGKCDSKQQHSSEKVVMCFILWRKFKHPTAGRHHLFLSTTGCFHGAENTCHGESNKNQKKHPAPNISFFPQHMLGVTKLIVGNVTHFRSRMLT
jgi:hypothetical protein